ncbi:MAG TPA: sigma-70 family RNA polymerase sigma factor [Pyrinomonadaceae bacterium]|nr:sigma-70 family RNA polymerase sigma factor [Pyrinomonadaceae bacterium]
MRLQAADMMEVETGQPGAHTGTLMNSTEELVARVRGGDEEAFRLIFERYARPLLSFIYDMVGERGLAEDLTQETFVRAYKGLGSLRDEARLSTWLFSIAKNVARESLRTRRRHAGHVELDDEGVVFELHDERPSPAGNLLDKELSGVIQKALAKLDEDKRLVFTLKVFQQRSYEEIAEITGFSIGKLKTDLHRARAEMRRRVGPYLGGEQ